MSIQTETTYEVKIGETVVDTIGLSNTLDTYTWDEIKDYNYVGSWTECYRQMSHRSPSNTTYIGYASTVGDCPFAASWHGGYTNFNISGYGTSLYNFDAAHGIYRKLILLNDSTDNYPTFITVNNRSNFKIITEFDAKKYALEYDAVKMLDSTFYSLYNGLSHQSLKYHTHLGQANDDDSAILISFRPYFIIEFESTYYCLRADIVAYRTMSASYLTNSGMAQCYNNLPDVSNTNSKYTGICEAMENWFSDTALQTAVAVPFIQNANTNNTYYCSQEKYIMKIEFGVNNSGFLVDYAFKTEEDLLLFIAGTYGIHFIVNETIYKPIIQSNFVTGYTEQLDTVSDLDNYTDTNHDMPVTPPEPTPPEPSGDDIDKQHFGGGTALGGAENLWLLTTAQMTSLHNAISSCDVPNFEPLNSIISVMGLAIPPTYPLGTDIATLITINIRKTDGTLWSTHTEGHICDKQTASFGFTNNIKVKRKYNNFLDYPPYSSHEIFLPLCGWLPLPAYAVGRNLTVYYVHDINTCSVRGLVFCEGSLIGEKYGTMGANIPFSSTGHGLYVGGLITGGVQTLADFATAVSTKGPMALISAVNGVAEGANTLLASNQNRTSVIGQNQDRTSFADGQYIRIKSTYPDVKIEENFGHTFGFVCNKKGLLKDFKGFTTCENPHVYGFSCTSEEKDEIERLLKAGIIINIPEE